jgi:peptidyl-tRNA hydrolase, PTH1 family
MKLIVGLGNPGEKYLNTRHNFGFQIVEHFIQDYPGTPAITWEHNDKLKSDIAFLDWQPKVGQMERVIVAKPQTYMNNSGMAVSLLISFYKIPTEDLWVVYDELDLPVGQMKIRFGGAAAGHHGVESIIEKIGSDKFWRFRMGIGESNHHTGRAIREEGKRHPISKQNVGDAQEFVLGTFSSSERGKARELLKHGSQALQMALEKGIDVAMNRFNTK